MLALCTHRAAARNHNPKNQKSNGNFWRPRAPHVPTGAFIACARLLHAVRRISRPKRVLWVCFGATFALLNRLQQQRSGSAAQQVSSTDHPTPGKLRKAITSSPAVGTTSSVINQTARRHIRLPRRPRPTAAVVIMARLILALVLALAIAGAWCTFPSGRFCTVCCLEFARAPRAVATAPPSRRRPGRWCGVWRLHAGVQVWRLWVVRARQEGAFQALPPCTNLTALIDLCLNGAR